MLELPKIYMKILETIDRLHLKIIFETSLIDLYIGPPLTFVNVMEYVVCI